MKLVQVIWEDAAGASGWQATTDIDHRPDVITSVGWLVRHDKVGLTICQSVNASDRIADTLFVPSRYVRCLDTILDAPMSEGA